MDNYEKLIRKHSSLAVVGLGYVGLPLAVAFSEHFKTIGFDINKSKIELLKKGIDPTHEVGDEILKKSLLLFTSNEDDLSENDINFFIVAVPTPINPDTTPDLRPVIEASKTVAKHLRKEAIVVYESTVYPGVTEDVCLPILETISGMKCGSDFKIGYSPERINPGDRKHRLKNIKKIVSGIDAETLDQVAAVYSTVVEAGIHKAPSIKIAEAAKVIENSQRDINIAFMNELSIIFHRLGIDTKSVLDAARTKWNFLPFSPGLVGGHCIGIDPYYLTYKAKMSGYDSQVILSGRRVNDSMGKYVAENAIKELIKAGMSIQESRIGILGMTFKENCPDSRNSKVNDIIKELREYNIEPLVCDPIADAREVRKLYGINLSPISKFKNLNALIIAVAHDEFKRLSLSDISHMFWPDLPKSKCVLLDVKSIYSLDDLKKSGFLFWRL